MESWVGVLLIGAAVGFFAGMFGKGGSALATPLLHAIGIPAMVALAAPLPATIPSTLIASGQYRRRHLIDDYVVWRSVAFGVPATIAGALASTWVGGNALVLMTDGIVVGLGLMFLLRPSRSQGQPERAAVPSGLHVALVAVVAGGAAGLLANSGGFLLAPLYLSVLRLPIKRAFGASLAVAAALAIPGTMVHWALGHIHWTLVAVFALGSIPLSRLGARAALRTDSAKLERVYGLALAALGTAFLISGR